ncbi:hypothetical protein C4J81_06385 [Deltaproteobacteria bacterium Smac51]|nr:hypothetical protein C4J81_06385 [Deltaproteobacteria bacterium Smac51]
MARYLNPIFKGLILLLLALSALYLPKAMLLYSGYCFEEECYLTTQEKFDIVVREIISEKNESNSKEGVEIFNYSSLEDFYAINQDCCEFTEIIWYDGEIFFVPFGARISGQLNIFIRVYYLYGHESQNNNVPVYVERYFGLSNCGRLWTPYDVYRLRSPEW